MRSAGQGQRKTTIKAWEFKWDDVPSATPPPPRPPADVLQFSQPTRPATPPAKPEPALQNSKPPVAKQSKVAAVARAPLALAPAVPAPNKLETASLKSAKQVALESEVELPSPVKKPTAAELAPAPHTHAAPKKSVKAWEFTWDDATFPSADTAPEPEAIPARAEKAPSKTEAQATAVEAIHPKTVSLDSEKSAPADWALVAEDEDAFTSERAPVATIKRRKVKALPERPVTDQIEFLMTPALTAPEPTAESAPEEPGELVLAETLIAPPEAQAVSSEDPTPEAETTTVTIRHALAGSAATMHRLPSLPQTAEALRELKEERKTRMALENRLGRETARRTEAEQKAREVAEALESAQKALRDAEKAHLEADARARAAAKALADESAKRAQAEFERKVFSDESEKAAKARDEAESRARDAEARATANRDVLAVSRHSVRGTLVAHNESDIKGEAPEGLPGGDEFEKRLRGDLVSYQQGGRTDRDHIVIPGRGPRGTTRSVEVTKVPRPLMGRTPTGLPLPRSTEAAPAVVGRLTLSSFKKPDAETVEPGNAELQFAETATDAPRVAPKSETVWPVQSVFEPRNPPAVTSEVEPIAKEEDDAPATAPASPAMENILREFVKEPLVMNALRLAAIMRTGVDAKNNGPRAMELIGILHNSLSGMEVSLASKGVRQN